MRMFGRVPLGTVHRAPATSRARERLIGVHEVTAFPGDHLMGCRLFEGELDAYFDAELNAESSTVIREHLDKCACCRGRLAERVALASLVRAVPFYSAPDHLRERVLAQALRSRSVCRTVAC